MTERHRLPRTMLLIGLDHVHNGTASSSAASSDFDENGQFGVAKPAYTYSFVLAVFRVTVQLWIIPQAKRHLTHG